MRVPCALLLLLTAGLARAGEPPAGGAWLELAGATVQASPGLPQALAAWLPPVDGGPTAISWPLPAGDVVVLGLPDRDPAAQRLCDVFQLDVDDLRGGYALWAWRDGERSIVVVMAADPAALLAARFEFDAEASAVSTAPSMRSLDFHRPAEEAVLRVHAGTRRVTPRWRTRAWWMSGATGPDDAVTAAGAHASHVWIVVGRDPEQDARVVPRIRQLRAQGITPVLVADLLLGRAFQARGGERARALLARWQRSQGVRDFAVAFPDDAHRTAAEEERAVKDVVAALRPGGLDTLTVVPGHFCDRRVEAAYPPGPALPDLRDVPEARIAWSGPWELSRRITRADAERRVREARGVPVVLLETWAERSLPVEVPSVPRGREPGLEEVLDGVVVVGPGAAAEPVVAACWAPEEPRFGLPELQRLVPIGASEPVGFARGLREAVEAADREGLGLVPWMAPMAAELRATEAALAEAPAAATVPVVPAGAVADGRIDEPAWAYARKLAGAAPGVEALAFSDGHALHLALRIARGDPGTERFPLQVAVGAPGRTMLWQVSLSPVGADTVREVVVEDEVAALLPLGDEHVQAVVHADDTRVVAEIVFDRFACGGDAYAGRRFDLRITSDSATLWPVRAPPDRRPGVLVVAR